MTKRIITPFANSGTKNTIPDTAPGSDDGFANYPNGFPASNSVDPALGGTYVKRADFNGAMFDVTSILKDFAQGLLYTYDATYSTAISGYPANAILRATGGGLWLNVLGSANTSNPDTGGAGWLLINPTKQVPTGSIFHWTGNSATPPTGYIFGEGAALSRTAYADLFALWVTNAGFTSQTFTCTIASPAVFTKTTHGFTGGERLRLSTTGALPTGLSTSVDYFVEVLTANTFYLSSASRSGNGTRIITTGTQSGTHSFMQSLYGLGDGSTTFNAPNTQGAFIRCLDKGAGVDTGRAFATWQKGSLSIVDTGTAGTLATGGVVSISDFYVTTPPTTAQALRDAGLDAYIAADNPVSLYISSISPPGATSLLPGTGGNDGATGQTRPVNIAFPSIIKV